MTPIVLVHGSFIDRRCWNEVEAALLAHGLVVASVELHPRSLAADTAAVQSAVDELGGVVIACGWSYGGMVITGLALSPGSQLVYLNALVPDHGESAISIAESRPGGIEQLLGFDASGDLVLQGDMDPVLWGDAPAHQLAAMHSALRSQSMASFLEAPGRIAWRDVPSTFVAGRHDKVFSPELLELMASRVSTVIEWDTSHSAVLCRPDLVAELLENLASPSAAR